MSSLLYLSSQLSLLERFTILGLASKEYIREQHVHARNQRTHVWIILWVKFGKEVSGTFRHHNVEQRSLKSDYIPFPGLTISNTNASPCYTRAYMMSLK